LSTAFAFAASETLLYYRNFAIIITAAIANTVTTVNLNEKDVEENTASVCDKLKSYAR